MRHYNETKLLVLAHLARSGWQDYRETAQAVGWHEPRSMATYLGKLWRWGLLYRRTLPRTEYLIAEKGRARLAWLKSQSR
jgi:hypothetical protein